MPCKLELSLHFNPHIPHPFQLPVALRLQIKSLRHHTVLQTCTYFYHDPNIRELCGNATLRVIFLRHPCPFSVASDLESSDRLNLSGHEVPWCRRTGGTARWARRTCYGERSRLQLLFKLQGAQRLSNLAGNVLAVNVLAVNRPSPLCILPKTVF